MEFPLDIIFEQKQLYDQNLYNIRLILSNLYKEMLPKDCTMTFDDTRYRLLDTLYTIEGTFPFRFILFMDTYLISHIYLVVFTESDPKTDYNDFCAIYPQMNELPNKSMVQSVRVLNPLINETYMVYDAYLIDDTEKQTCLNSMKGKVSVYYQSLSDNALSKIPPQFKNLEDWFMDYFKSIGQPKKQEPNTPQIQNNGDFEQIGLPSMQEILKRLRPEDHVKLMRGESIELDFGYGKMVIQGIPMGEVLRYPPNSANTRAEFIVQLNKKLQDIFDNTVTPLPITPNYINLIYTNLEKDGFFSSEQSQGIQKIFGTPEDFKRFVKNIIRQFFKRIQK